jgi:hypothetical protein
MSSSRIEGTNVRSTAATRLLFEDFEVDKVIQQLEESNARFAEAVDKLRLAKNNTIESQLEVDSRTQVLTNRVTAAIQASPNIKVSQAEIDRRIKQELGHDEALDGLKNELVDSKLALDLAQAAFDAEKIQHRTLTTKANLVTASLNFLGASKTARAAALAHLSEV